MADEVDASAGYFAGRAKAVMAAVVGVHGGRGVVVNRESGDRTYMDIEAFELGAGVAARSYGLVAVVEDPELLEQIRFGVHYSSVEADIAAGTAGRAAALARVLEGARIFVLPESGAGLSTTLQTVTLSVNDDLNDTGLTDISIPNAGFDGTEKEGGASVRKWARPLPFFAQGVIDKGIDLPLPWGSGSPSR